MKRQEKEEHPWTGHKCDECLWGRWNDVQWNRDIHGRPITLRCKYYRDGKVGILRGTQACENFKIKK